MTFSNRKNPHETGVNPPRYALFATAQTPARGQFTRGRTLLSGRSRIAPGPAAPGTGACLPAREAPPEAAAAVKITQLRCATRQR